MDVSDNKGALSYIFTHARTEGSTGWYACLPEFGESLERELARLASRPLDSFLRQKLLSDLGGLSAASLQDLARRCLASESPDANGGKDSGGEAWRGVVACLLLERAALGDETRLQNFLEDLRKAADVRFSPFPDILQGGNAGNEYWASLIRDLPESPPAAVLDKARFKNLPDLEKCGGSLNRARAGFVFHGEAKERPHAGETAALARERLERAGLLLGPEMRHEASLSPIALLRQWNVNAEINHARHRHTLRGTATAFGRGLSLAQARASCLMEIVERASAHLSVRPGGEYNQGEVAGLLRPRSLIYGSQTELRGENLYIPMADGEWRDVPLYWIEGEDAAGGKALAPAQAVFLFSNLDEASVYERDASTGLASGNSMQEAKLAALTEILERDACATTLFDWRHCFIPASRDETLQSLLNDYRAKGIFPVMQDISNESGFPVYRCAVRDGQGRAFCAAGAGLDGKKAALSALTETPWPYSWSSPFPSERKSAPPPAGLPIRYLEDLPNFSLAFPEADLALLEKILIEQGRTPVYFDISRADLQFPVARAFIPEMETNGEYGRFLSPGPRFFARNYHIFKNYF